MKQLSKNYKLENFEIIKEYFSLERYAKICDYCGEIFEADINIFYSKKFYRIIKCPICFSIYYIAYNDLNDFYYLELAKESFLADDEMVA